MGSHKMRGQPIWRYEGPRVWPGPVPFARNRSKTLKNRRFSNCGVASVFRVLWGLIKWFNIIYGGYYLGFRLTKVMCFVELFDGVIWIEWLCYYVDGFVELVFLDYYSEAICETIGIVWEVVGYEVLTVFSSLSINLI